MSDPYGYAPVAVARRSGVVESVHRGAVVVLGATGEVLLSVGDPDTLIYPRSSNKPMQALAMVESGLDLPSDLLALACSSHCGEAMHLAGVRRLLDRGGLDETSLANTPDLPLGDAARLEAIRAGIEPSRLSHNCSGKHGAMLVTCVVNGWAPHGYLEPEHPLQQRITATLSRLTGRSPLFAGIDGCGAPAHVLTLRELATGYGAMASGAAGAAALSIGAAMTTHPELVGGTDSHVSTFMRAVPGLLAKEGADGVYAGAFPDGRCLAVKIGDGSARAQPVVFAAALAALDIDLADARSAWEVMVLGHGRPVGRVEPVGPLAGLLPAAR